jgi:glycosyltransferase involved in cell wall biosynthesis
MRVCLITSAPLPPEEGVGYHVWNLACLLAKRGHRIGLITRGSMAPLEEVKSDGVTIWHVPFAPLYPVHVYLHGFFVDRLLKRIEGGFDLINAHTPLPPAVNTSLPVVTTVHSPMRADAAATSGTDFYSLATRMQSLVSQDIEAAIFRRSQKITAVARWVGRALRQYGVDPASITVTGNGVESCFLKSPCVQQRKPYVLYVGRLESSKGLLELVAAAKEVIQRVPELNLRFVLVGKGPLLPKLQKLVSRAGLQVRFDFRGHVDSQRRNDLVRLYNTASIFVLPSHHEGMPTTLLEAMASGLPVVSTSVGGALEAVTDGVNGLLVPPREPGALAEALIVLLEDPALCQRLGQKARASVEESYSWDVVGERYLTCYEQVLGHGK